MRAWTPSRNCLPSTVPELRALIFQKVAGSWHIDWYTAGGLVRCLVGFASLRVVVVAQLFDRLCNRFAALIQGRAVQSATAAARIGQLASVTLQRGPLFVDHVRHPIAGRVLELRGLEIGAVALASPAIALSRASLRPMFSNVCCRADCSSGDVIGSQSTASAAGVAIGSGGVPVTRAASAAVD